MSTDSSSKPSIPTNLSVHTPREGHGEGNPDLPDSHPLEIQVITDEATLFAMAAQWNELADSSNQDSVFMRWEWISSWWRHYARGLNGQLYIVAMTDPDVGNQLVGLAPLYLTDYRTRFEPTPFQPQAQQTGQQIAQQTAQQTPPHPATRPAPPLKPATSGELLIARFLGTGGDTSPEYLSTIAAPGWEKPVASTLANHILAHLLQHKDWLGIDFTDHATDNPMGRLLYERLKKNGGHRLSVISVPHSVCKVVTFPEDNKTAYFNNLPRKLRYNIRSRENKLIEEHQARFFVWDESEGEVPDAISKIQALHHKRFYALGSTHSFASQEYNHFHQEIARLFQQQGILRLYCMEAAGSLVAMLYCFRYKGRVFHFQSGFDPDWSKSGVGQVLISWAISQASEEGASHFDFLKGEYAYKDDWSNNERQTLRLIAVPTYSLTGLGYMFTHHLRPEIGLRLRGGRTKP